MIKTAVDRELVKELLRLGVFEDEYQATIAVASGRGPGLVKEATDKQAAQKKEKEDSHA